MGYELIFQYLKDVLSTEMLGIPIFPMIMVFILLAITTRNYKEWLVLFPINAYVWTVIFGLPFMNWIILLPICMLTAIGYIAKTHDLMYYISIRESRKPLVGRGALNIESLLKRKPTLPKKEKAIRPEIIENIKEKTTGKARRIFDIGTKQPSIIRKRWRPKRLTWKDETVKIR